MRMAVFGANRAHELYDVAHSENQLRLFASDTLSTPERRRRAQYGIFEITSKHHWGGELEDASPLNGLYMAIKSALAPPAKCDNINPIPPTRAKYSGEQNTHPAPHPPPGKTAAPLTEVSGGPETLGRLDLFSFRAATTIRSMG